MTSSELQSPSTQIPSNIIRSEIGREELEPFGIALWNKQELTPLFGKGTPLIEHLDTFLRENPHYECFRCQDEIIKKRGMDRVQMWSKRPPCLVEFSKCPLRKDLLTYLIENSDHVVYRGQDGILNSDGYQLVDKYYFVSRNGCVLIWDPLNICKLREEESPPYQYLYSFLGANPGLEIYTDQGERMPVPRSVLRRKYADQNIGSLYRRNQSGQFENRNGRVLLWNKESQKKWLAGSSPLEKQLFSFLQHFPRYEVYDGQDMSSSNFY